MAVSAVEFDSADPPLQGWSNQSTWIDYVFPVARSSFIRACRVDRPAGSDLPGDRWSLDTFGRVGGGSDLETTDCISSDLI